MLAEAVAIGDGFQGLARDVVILIRDEGSGLDGHRSRAARARESPRSAKWSSPIHSYPLPVNASTAILLTALAITGPTARPVASSTTSRR